MEHHLDKPLPVSPTSPIAPPTRPPPPVPSLATLPPPTTNPPPRSPSPPEISRWSDDSSTVSPSPPLLPKLARSLRQLRSRIKASLASHLPSPGRHRDPTYQDPRSSPTPGSQQEGSLCDLLPSPERRNPSTPPLTTGDFSAELDPMFHALQDVLETTFENIESILVSFERLEDMVKVLEERTDFDLFTPLEIIEKSTIAIKEHDSRLCNAEDRAHALEWELRNLDKKCGVLSHTAERTGKDVKVSERFTGLVQNRSQVMSTVVKNVNDKLKTVDDRLSAVLEQLDEKIAAANARREDLSQKIQDVDLQVARHKVNFHKEQENLMDHLALVDHLESRLDDVVLRNQEVTDGHVTLWQQRFEVLRHLADGAHAAWDRERQELLEQIAHMGANRQDVPAASTDLNLLEDEICVLEDENRELKRMAAHIFEKLRLKA
ncbi:hypothetical protein N7535_008874 [Penicillium sp. DV-2018c]|nr:hypothetical protein N7535_008874 [Penicillium sp. DV-2018c]